MVPDIVEAYSTVVFSLDTGPPVYDAIVALKLFTPVFHGLLYLLPAEKLVVLAAQVPVLTLEPQGWMPKAGFPDAGKTAGAGVSFAVNPLPPFASAIQNPLAGFINLPEEVAVIA